MTRDEQRPGSPITRARRLEAALRRLTPALQAPEEGLSDQALRALQALDACPGVTVTELADVLSASVPSVSRLTVRLSIGGLVDRAVNASNRRQTLLRLSDEGRRTWTSVVQGRASGLRPVVRGLGEEDTTQLITLLERADELRSVR